MSLRVVNLAGSGLENQLKLRDGDDDPGDHEEDDNDLPDLSKVIPIRGWTLFFLGPDSRLRLWLYKMLVKPCGIFFTFSRCCSNDCDQMD
jgi:hypothetical protein